MACHTALPLHLSHSVLEIMLLEVLHVHGRHEDRCVSEQVVHLLEWSLRGLRLDSPEEQGVCEIADDLERVLAGIQPGRYGLC